MGGSSGGGGGGSGVVDYPDYMKTQHEDWLDDLDTVITAAVGNSPWTGVVAFDPTADITAYETVIAGFAAILAGITDTTDWAALYTQAETSIDATSEALIIANVAAFADNLDDEITTKVLPRFQSGMLDINAVVSSAFVIGEAVIEGFRNREVAKFEGDLRISTSKADGLNRLNATEQMLRLMLQRITFEESYMKAYIEGKRIKIVAEKEELDMNTKIDEADALWDLEVFQHGANMLAAIGGGTANPKGKEPSQAQSVIGGAMAGAAAGTMVMPGWGTAIGAVLGAASAYM